RSFGDPRHLERGVSLDRREEGEAGLESLGDAQAGPRANGGRPRRWMCAPARASRGAALASSWRKPGPDAIDTAAAASLMLPATLRGSMSETLPLEAAPFGLDAVLRARGFERLTPIQSAVLDPALAGRDLRMSSQTGSGKTVAVGLVLAESVLAHERAGD